VENEIYCGAQNIYKELQYYSLAVMNIILDYIKRQGKRNILS
jgi:hypothetical protein